MVDDFGGTDSDQGTYGPVGPTSGSEPAPSSSGTGGTVGPAGPPGPAGPAGPSIDLWAATRIVSPNPDEGTDLTIQEAIDNLPAEGGLIYVKPGTYSISTPIVMPDKSVVFTGPGVVLAPVGAIALLSVPDGLTEFRLYTFRNFKVEGDPALNQTFVSFSDTAGFGNIELRNMRLTGLKNYVDWVVYNENYDTQAVVAAFDCYLQAIPGGSVLAQTPNPAGNYFAAVGLKFFRTSFDGVVDGGSFHAWFADADCDLLIELNSLDCDFVAGSAMNGITIHAGSMSVVGNGDVEFFGNGWDIYDFINSGSFVGSIDPTLTPAFYSDARLVHHGTLEVDDGSFASCALRIEGKAGRVSIKNCFDGLGISNPGIELAGDSGIVRHTCFQKGGVPATVFPAGCIKLSGKKFGKIHDNDFSTAVTGKTILEVAPADSNMVHDNTGTANGTGMTLVGAATIAQAHNNI